MLGLTGQRFLSISTQLAPLGTTLDHMSTRQRYLGKPKKLSPQGTPPRATAQLGTLPQTLPGVTSSETPPRAPPAPVDEDKEGDADGEALLADADGLQDARVAQLAADHVGLKQPRLLGTRG